VLAAAIVRDEETSKLSVVNDLLNAANYWSLNADPLGWLTSAPYQAPETRGVDWFFSDDPSGGGLYLDGWDYDQDFSQAPNRLIAIQKVDGEDPPLVAIAEDTNPESKLSFPGRGRWVAKTETVEAPDQDTLDQIAARRLREAQSVAITLTVEHPFQPEVVLNSVVSFQSKRLDAPILGTVGKQQIRLRTGGLVKTTIRGLL
jgi:hypothetical protein